jgi:hypothetical protein
LVKDHDGPDAHATVRWTLRGLRRVLDAVASAGGRIVIGRVIRRRPRGVISTPAPAPVVVRECSVVERGWVDLERDIRSEFFALGEVDASSPRDAVCTWRRS